MKKADFDEKVDSRQTGEIFKKLGIEIRSTSILFSMLQTREKDLLRFQVLKLYATVKRYCTNINSFTK